MPWPHAHDFQDAVLNPQISFKDVDLCSAEVVKYANGLPIPASGNFGIVYQMVHPDGRRWAVKCFTVDIPGRGERYQKISAHLRRIDLPFLVGFDYLPEGVFIKGEWFPILKMEWVEGQTLNRFVADRLDQPALLKTLTDMWPKVARGLRQAQVTHADLQHANIMLVPGKAKGSVSLKLVDYDGMYLPELAGTQSGESGHPSYQHPSRVTRRLYGPEVDRFSHLVIYAALRALMSCGQRLWDTYSAGDDLLLRPSDFREPSQSALLHTLWLDSSADVRTLAGRVVLATKQDLDAIPLLEDVVQGTEVKPLTSDEAGIVSRLLAGQPVKVSPVPVARAVGAEIFESDAVSDDMLDVLREPTLSVSADSTKADDEPTLEWRFGAEQGPRTPHCRICEQPLTLQPAKSPEGGIRTYAGVLCYSCKQVTCHDCAPKPYSTCSVCGKRTVPCAEHHYRALEGLKGVVVMADGDQQAELLRYWKTRGEGHEGICTELNCVQSLRGNGYLVGWWPELRCAKCARAFLDGLLRDGTTINYFCQQLGEARLAARRPPEATPIPVAALPRIAEKEPAKPAPPPPIPPSPPDAARPTRTVSRLNGPTHAAVRRFLVWILIGGGILGAVVAGYLLTPNPFDVNRCVLVDRLDWKRDLRSMPGKTIKTADDLSDQVNGWRAQGYLFLLVDVTVPKNADDKKLRHLDPRAWRLLLRFGRSQNAADVRTFRDPIQLSPAPQRIVLLFVVRPEDVRFDGMQLQLGQMSPRTLRPESAVPSRTN